MGALEVLQRRPPSRQRATLPRGLYVRNAALTILRAVVILVAPFSISAPITLWHATILLPYTPRRP